jgi:hypothetical protein
MNNVAILPRTIMYLLQNQNVKREIAKKAQTMPIISTLVPGADEGKTSNTPPAKAHISEPVKTSEEDGTNIIDLFNKTMASYITQST